ncbi:MAG TPA: SMC family ATPase, partial [Anaerolineaceae bacterium]|nr:SMC family ATPase [Anaerolineaceae bacterium]
MIPIALKLSGFLSYREPVAIDFTPFDLAAISGSNGAGKSSLLDAITWALFGQARRRDDAIIHTGAEAAEVVFDFEYEGQRYRVQRTKPRNKTTILEFFIYGDQGWRALTEHSLRETETRIQQTLRLDFDTFTNASFFLQGKADQFAQQRPSDRKRILSSILGLEVWDVYRDEAGNRRRNEENRLTILDGQLREIQAELDQEDVRRERLGQLQGELEQVSLLLQAHEASLDSLRKLTQSLQDRKSMVDLHARQLDQSRGRLAQHEHQLADRQAECEQFRQQIEKAGEIEAAYRQWQADRQELERWNQVAENFRQYERERAAPLLVIETERTRLEEERRGCLQQQAQADAVGEQIPQMDAAIQADEEKIAALAEKLGQRELRVQEQRELMQSQTEALAENKKLRDAMHELKERIETLKGASGADCPLCGQPLSPDERTALIETLELQGRNLGDQYRNNQAVCKEAEARQKAIEQEMGSFKLVEQEIRQQEQRLAQAQSRRDQLDRALSEWEAGGARRLAEIEQVLAAENFALEARQELARLDAALKDLGYDAAAHDEIRRAEHNGRASETQLRLLETARATLAPLEREIAGLQKQIEAEQAELMLQQAAYQEAEEKYRRDSENLPSLEQAENELFALKSRENQIRMQVGGAQQQVEILKTLRTRQGELNGQRNDLTRQIARLKALERAFSKDGIPALLIEQSLPDIEDQANEILQRLSNGAMTVRFDTQRDYKDKSRADKRETLDIVISDPSGPREYEMFSGGEAFRVNFAIRLALSKVLAQ